MSFHFFTRYLIKHEIYVNRPKEMLQCFVSWILINYSLIISFIKIWIHFYKCLSDGIICYNEYKVDTQSIQIQAIICTLLFISCLVLHNKWINNCRVCCCWCRKVPFYSDPFRFHYLAVTVLIIVYEIAIFKILSQFPSK